MDNFFNKFQLHPENEDYEIVIKNIEIGVTFRGTNLWVLIFAIFIASLGLNVNSTAVIIGAMLISPLMGPIMGIGLGMGINDVALLRKSLNNFLIATGVALTTSTFFFLLSPIDDAHSEILARTSPTIYDVLIALFGGFAGIVATTSKQKGNVIPGVAIATALMPPLCTAGYGLATLQFSFFFGAFYLFVINTVFIALATFIFVRLQHFPFKHLQDEKAENVARHIVWVVVLITLLPSIYLGYEMIQQKQFEKVANNFIVNEAQFANDYLLNKRINSKEKIISLVFGGNEISVQQINQLKLQLKKYDLKDVTLEVKQGFAYLAENSERPQKEQVNQLSKALAVKEIQEKSLQLKLDSIQHKLKLGLQIYAELKSTYPHLKSAIVQPSTIYSDSARAKQSFLVLLSFAKGLTKRDKGTIEKWLRIRLNENNITLAFQ
ncbi:MAG: TIGR00341 family protein [Ferruginibacter sp.]